MLSIFFTISAASAGTIEVAFDAPTNSSYSDYFTISILDDSGLSLRPRPQERTRVLVPVLMLVPILLL